MSRAAMSMLVRESDLMPISQEVQRPVPRPAPNGVGPEAYSGRVRTIEPMRDHIDSPPLHPEEGEPTTDFGQLGSATDNVKPKADFKLDEKNLLTTVKVNRIQDISDITRQLTHGELRLLMAELKQVAKGMEINLNITADVMWDWAELRAKGSIKMDEGATELPKFIDPPKAEDNTD